MSGASNGGQPQHRGAGEGRNLLQAEFQHFNDLDGILSADQERLIERMLRKEQSLRSILAENDRELQLYSDLFIDDHCNQIENLCKLYREMGQADKKLQEFEEEISKFQSRLTDTADGIVQMQQDTMTLLQRVDNHKRVGQRIKAVYDALNECGTFCETIANAEKVDETFTTELRQLEFKIGFLADNDDLRESAVYLDIHPKLQAAAEKAGDKLHRFLTKRFHSLTEENTNLAMVQQAIVKSGQYAYAFLSRYNPPIAGDLSQQYVNIMTEAYQRGARHAVKDLHGITATVSRPIIELVAASLIEAMRGGSCILPILAKLAEDFTREPPVPLKQRFLDAMNSKPAEERRREAVFEDKVLAFYSVSSSSHETLVLDAAIRMQLQRTKCWVARFNDIMATLVGNVMAESRFIANFFFNGGSAGTTEQTEYMMRCVFSKSYGFVMESLLAEVAGVTDLPTLFTALRCLELFKNIASQHPDPTPLLFLASSFERLSSALGDRLRAVMQVHTTSLERATVSGGLRMPPAPAFKGSAATAPLLERLTSDKALAASLAPHPIIRIFARAAGQMVFLNTVRHDRSRLSLATPLRCFDDKIQSVLFGWAEKGAALVHAVAAQHASPEPRRVTTIHALGHILHVWAQLEESQAQVAPVSGDAPNAVGAASGVMSPLPQSLSAAAAAAAGGRSGLRGADGEPSDGSFAGPSAAPVSLLQQAGGPMTGCECALYLRRALLDAVQQFVDAELEGTPLAPAVAFVRAQRLRLGADFFADADGAASLADGAASSMGRRSDDAAPANESSPPTAAATLTPPDEAETTAVMTVFGKNYVETLQRSVDRIRTYFLYEPRALPAGVASGGGDGRQGSVASVSASVARDRSVSQASAASSASVSRGAGPTGGRLSAADETLRSLYEPDARCMHELTELVLRSYCQSVIELGNTMLTVASRFFGRHSFIQAKIVGSQALSHETKRALDKLWLLAGNSRG